MSETGATGNNGVPVYHVSFAGLENNNQQFTVLEVADNLDEILAYAHSVHSGKAGQTSEILNQDVRNMSTSSMLALLTILLEAHDTTMKAKTEQLRLHTTRKSMYANVTKMLQDAQANASHKSEGSEKMYLSQDDLADLRYSPEEIETIMKYNTNDDNVISVYEYVQYINNEVIGADKPHLHIDVEETAHFGDYNQFSSNVLERVNGAQEANCADTTLLTSELQNSIQERQRLMSTFTNLMNKMHETEMAVIRNI